MPYYRRKSRWPYRSWRRRYSVQRSQQQGTRRFKVTLPVDEMHSVPIAPTTSAGAGSSYHFSVAPFCKVTSAPAGDALNYVCWANIISHPLYLVYSQLYDEVRIVGLKLCVSVMGYPSGVTSGGVKIVSCCDRRGNRDDVTALPNTAQLLNSADSLATEYTSLERAKQYRSFYARDLIERCSFYDASFTSWTVSSGAHSPYTYTANTAWRNNGSSGFCPMVVYRILFANAPTTAQSCAISIKAQWSLEFRNPKWNDVSVSKFGDMKAEAIGDLKSSFVEGEDDVDHDEEIDPRTGKKVKFEEPVYEESVVPDDDVGMDDESSQPELTKEQLLEMLRKLDEKKS